MRDCGNAYLCIPASQPKDWSLFDDAWLRWWQQRCIKKRMNVRVDRQGYLCAPFEFLATLYKKYFYLPVSWWQIYAVVLSLYMTIVMLCGGLSSSFLFTENIFAILFCPCVFYKVYKCNATIFFVVLPKCNLYIYTEDQRDWDKVTPIFLHGQGSIVEQCTYKTVIKEDAQVAEGHFMCHWLAVSVRVIAEYLHDKVDS